MKAVFNFKNKEKRKRNITYRSIGVSLAAIAASNMLLLPPNRLSVSASDRNTELNISPTDTAESASDRNTELFKTPTDMAESASDRNTELFKTPTDTAKPNNTEMNTETEILLTMRGNTTSVAADIQHSIQAPLNFNSAASDQGNLDTDGYQWSHSAKTLKLKNVDINSTVTLPDTTVTIETEGNCSISELSAGSDPSNTQINFSGTGELTITEQININGGDNNTLTVSKGAHVVAKGGISIGASGGVNSIVTVNGALTAESNGGSAIYGGKVVVGSDGLLKVSGNGGVSLNGLNKTSSGKDFTNVFTVERDGCFTANCNVFNIRIESGSMDTNGVGYFPAGSNADQAINVPEGYLPTDCEVMQSEGVIKLIKKSTGNEYTGALTIHENHVWSDNWNKDETRHWKECTLEGCDKISEYSVHTYNNNTWTCTACGANLDITLNDAGGLTYNGQEQKPGVTVTVDKKRLDASKYETSYNNNINSGKASVTVTGKGDLSFERTVEFLIAKAIPTITWDSAMQTVTYSANQTTITPPSVTLVNGENFGGEINYSYTTSGSFNAAAGLPTNAGTYTVKAHIAEQGNYTAADSTNTLTLTIDQAENAPNMPSGSMNVAKRYEKVDDVELPDNWQWQEPDKNTALEIGVPVTSTAVYTGADKDNYKNITATVVITRSNCDHENTELKNVVASTCQQKGYSGDTYCLDCGELLTKGTQTDLADHSGGTATCISGKICVICGTEYTAKDSKVHIHTEIRGQKNAACNSKGYTGDTFCTDCGTKILSGKTIPATGHDWQVTGEKKPTYTENGVITYTCSRCGDTYTKLVDKLKNTTSTTSKSDNSSAKATPAKQEKRSPQTGEP